MFADRLRSAIEAASRSTLPAVTAQLWRAFGEGHVSEAEAEALSGLIEARQVVFLNQEDRGTPQDRARRPRTGTGSRPRTEASLERRRRWAASGRLPPAIAAKFTLGEQAALARVAAEIACRKDCRLAVGNIAAVAGVSETTVRNAIREAVRLGLVTVEERRISRWRNDTNVVRIVSTEWIAWLRLGRKRKEEPTPMSEEGGCKSAKGTSTEVLDLGKTRPVNPPQGLPEGSGRPSKQRTARKRRGR